MKRFIIGGLSILLLSTVAAPAEAETEQRVQAFNLVELARRGYLQDQGIPAYNSLSSAVQLGRVTAEDVIQAAIAAERLNTGAMDDRGYVQAVENQLQDLIDRDHN